MRVFFISVGISDVVLFVTLVLFASCLILFNRSIFKKFLFWLKPANLHLEPGIALGWAFNIHSLVEFFLIDACLAVSLVVFVVGLSLFMLPSKGSQAAKAAARKMSSSGGRGNCRNLDNCYYKQVTQRNFNTPPSGGQSSGNTGGHNTVVTTNIYYTPDPTASKIVAAGTALAIIKAADNLTSPQPGTPSPERKITPQNTCKCNVM